MNISSKGKQRRNKMTNTITLNTNITRVDLQEPTAETETLKLIEWYGIVMDYFMQDDENRNMFTEQELSDYEANIMPTDLKSVIEHVQQYSYALDYDFITERGTNLENF